MKTLFTSALVAMAVLLAAPGCQMAASRLVNQHNAVVDAATVSWEKCFNAVDVDPRAQLSLKKLPKPSEGAGATLTQLTDVSFPKEIEKQSLSDRSALSRPCYKIALNAIEKANRADTSGSRAR